MINDRLLKPKQVAELIGYKTDTLNHWRWKGIGPKFEKLETGVIRYKETEVIKWIESQSIESKTEESSNI